VPRRNLRDSQTMTAEVDSPSSLFRLWRDLSQRAPDLTTRGTLSRRGAVKRALMITSRQDFTSELHVLLDHNQNKHVAARTVWGALAFVNVYHVRPGLLERAFLVLGLFLPDRKRRVLQGLGTAHSVKQILRPDAQLFVWNPTQIIHHCLIDHLGVSNCMIFNPIIPLPHNCQRYWGRKIVQKIYDIPIHKFNDVTPSYERNDNKPRVSIYMSKLPEDPAGQLSSEARIAEFGLFLSILGIETRFFFHYRDRLSVSKIRDFGLPIDICDFGESLNLLSTCQISITANSTVGLDLDSIGAGHFYCLTTERPATMAPTSKLTPLANYLSKSSRTLRKEETNEEWISKISQHEPALWNRIMKG